jgi:predicted NBD/HSP70 family sugar kinase
VPPSASRAYIPTHNQRLLLDLVRTRGPISRAEIVRLSKLTFPSVSRIVGELIERGLIEEKRQRRGGMGKPPIELELKPESAYALGLSLDGTQLTGVLVDLSGKVLLEETVVLEDSTPKTVVPLMLGLSDRLLGAQALPQGLLLGLGVSLPVPLHTDKVVSHISGSLSEVAEWQSLSLPDVLSQHVGCPVLVENDAKAAAISERWYGLGRNIRDFLYIFIAQGFGSGVILGGPPHIGFRGFGGELASVPAYNTPVGEAHDLGSYAAPRQLYRRLHEAGLGTTLADLETLYDARNEVVMDWLETTAATLAPVLVSSEFMLDPEAIIFGGRFPANLTDGLIEHIARRLPEYRHNSKTYQPQLLRGATGEYVAAIGAATLPIYQAMTPDVPHSASRLVAY